MRSPLWAWPRFFVFSKMMPPSAEAAAREKSILPGKICAAPEKNVKSRAAHCAKMPLSSAAPGRKRRFLRTPVWVKRRKKAVPPQPKKPSKAAQKREDQKRREWEFCENGQRGCMQTAERRRRGMACRRLSARLPENRAVNRISSIRPTVPPKKAAAALAARCRLGMARRPPRQKNIAVQHDRDAMLERASAARGEKRRQAANPQRSITDAPAGDRENAQSAAADRNSSKAQPPQSDAVFSVPIKACDYAENGCT